MASALEELGSNYGRRIADMIEQFKRDINFDGQNPEHRAMLRRIAGEIIPAVTPPPLPGDVEIRQLVDRLREGM
jgi:hypothetical protein